VPEGSTASNNSIPSSSSSSSSSGRVRLVHVFWDVPSCHPAGDDPRVVVAQLKRVLSCYGQLAGMYAYAVPKMFRWVPESFMLQYAPQRLPGGLMCWSVSAVVL
jgi:hypothetical protein